MEVQPELHKIDPYSVAELASKELSRVKQLPVTQPEVVDVKPVGLKDKQFEEYQMTIEVPVHHQQHQAPIHHSDTH